QGRAGAAHGAAARRRRANLRRHPARGATDRNRPGARSREARPRGAAAQGRHPAALRGGRASRPRRHLGLARAGRAEGHAQADRRQDPRRGREDFDRSRGQGEIRAHRQLSRHQHARCVRHLHPQGGGTLAKGDQGNRHQDRVRKHAMHARAIALALFAVLTGAAAAQERPEAFPSRSIKIVVPFPAGGPSDVLARLIGQKMSEDWGQPVVIENRPRANTVIGAQLVAKAAPDGYTLLMAIDSTLTMNQYLYRTPPYDPFTDFAPVTLTAKTMQLLIVNAASDVRTVKELIAKARTQPGKLNYGAGTIT